MGCVASRIRRRRDDDSSFSSDDEGSSDYTSTSGGSSNSGSTQKEEESERFLRFCKRIPKDCSGMLLIEDFTLSAGDIQQIALQIPSMPGSDSILWFRDCTFLPGTAAAIGKLLLQPNPLFSEFSYHDNNPDIDEGIAPMFTSSEGAFQHVRILDLQSNSRCRLFVRSDERDALAKMLKQTHRLRTLSLSFVDMSHPTMIDAIRDNTSLDEVTVSSTEVSCFQTCAQADNFFSVIASHPTITKLSLHEGNANDQTSEYDINRSMYKVLDNPCLTGLQLQQTYLHKASIPDFVGRLQQHQKLKNFEWSDYCLDRHADAIIFDFLPLSLESLCLTGNCNNPSDIDKLTSFITQAPALETIWLTLNIDRAHTRSVIQKLKKSLQAANGPLTKDGTSIYINDEVPRALKRYVNTEDM